MDPPNIGLPFQLLTEPNEPSLTIYESQLEQLNEICPIGIRFP